MSHRSVRCGHRSAATNPKSHPNRPQWLSSSILCKLPRSYLLLGIINALLAGSRDWTNSRGQAVPLLSLWVARPLPASAGVDDDIGSNNLTRVEIRSSVSLLQFKCLTMAFPVRSTTQQGRGRPLDWRSNWPDSQQLHGSDGDEVGGSL